MERRVGAHMFDRERCGEKWVRSERVSFHTSTTVKLFGVVGSFIHVLAKPSKLLLEGDVEKGR